MVRAAGILGVAIDQAGAVEIARRARGTPRIANRLLRRVRDFAEVRGDGSIDHATAEEGLALFRAQNPDAVFLDVRLGELSGVDVLRQLRQLNPTCPVVIITGHASDEEIAELRALGATDVLRKPLLLSRLTEALGEPDGGQAR